MTTHTAMRRRALFSRTLVLTALLVVAAAGSIFCTRSARADAPTQVTPEAQALAVQLISQGIGNPALGASAMQVLWGGGKNDNPPKSQAILLPSNLKNSMQPRVNPRGTMPSQRKTASAKSA